MKNSMSLPLVFMLILGVTLPAFGQTSFDSFELRGEVGLPPSPITPVNVSLKISFATGARSDGIDLLREEVAIKIQPPDPCKSPDRVCSLPTWRVLMQRGCFVAKTNSKYLVEYPGTCGATLALLFEDGSSQDMSEHILLLDASFKRLGNGREWRFGLDLELAADSPDPTVPPSPIVPPDPIHSRTSLSVGNDSGAAVSSLVQWKGASLPDDT